MAGEKVPAATDSMTTINNLLTTLGGTKTTTNAGNTAALEQVIADMRGQNPAAMLQSIFQQAGAQIPGIQGALGRSVGARSSKNSAVNAALQKLLASTTIAAQDQLVKQQLAQMQAQVPAAQAIAQTTQGTTKTNGTNLGEASKNLAILQLLSKSGILEKLGLGEAAKSMTGAAPAQATGPMQGPAAMAAAPAQMTGEMAPMQFPDLLMAASQEQAATQFPDLMMPDVGSGASSSPVTSQPNLDMFDLGSVTDMGPPQTAPVFYGDVIPGLEEWVLPVEEVYDNYADGGLIGRDGKKAAMEPEDDSEDMAEARDQVKFDDGFTANALMDSFRKLLGDSLGKPENYADGGVITAPGARRSSNPSITTEVITGTSAATGNSLSALTAALSTPVASSNPNKVSKPQAAGQTGSTADIGIPSIESGGQGNTAGTFGGGTGSFSPLSPSNRSAVQTAAQINALSGFTGGPSIPGFGLAAGLISAPTAEAAAKVGLTAAGNAITPGLGSLAGFALDPSLKAGVNALAALNPATAATNIGLSLFGLPTLGEITTNAKESLSPNNPMSPAQTQIAKDFAAAVAAGNTGSDVDFGAGNAPGTGNADGGRDSATGGGFMADGGKVKGKGSGISDNITINASAGEYMMSKDVVDTLGVEFFDALQAAFHTPAAVQKAMGAR